jgi:uncharacterized protein (TIGR02145 family)
MGKLIKYFNVFNFLILCFWYDATAQKVSNLKAAQDGQNIRITYELECSAPVEINLFFSEDNGKKWQPLKKGIRGDVGKGIRKGSHQIYWDVLLSMEKLVGNSFVFKVKCGDLVNHINIGTQVWMQDNLDVEYYQNGDPIIEIKESSEWLATSVGAWCYYSNEISNGETYGKLYNWFAVNDERRICPSGWHVPSEQDWNVLENYLGGSEIAGGKLKSLENWNHPNTGATNSSGFGALPGGLRSSYGNFSEIGNYGNWWSSSVFGTNAATHRLFHYYNYTGGNGLHKRCGLSVRCIRD